MINSNPLGSLGESVAKHYVDGAGRRVYGFDHDGVTIDNPAMDPAKKSIVSPQQYGFVVKEFAGGRTAWTREFSNGTMFVLNPSTKSHVLSGAEAVRVMFVSPEGDLLQDTRLRLGTSFRPPELATVRVTVNVVVDLLGATPDAAKNAVLRQVGRSLAAGLLASGDVEVLSHSFELSEVVSDAQGSADYANTNFSQLLDL
jgi:hypothetical protein